MGAHRNLLSLAVCTAQDSATYLKDNKTALETVKENLDRDVKVHADKKLESFILERLSSASVYPILSEETEKTVGKANSDGFRWIIDPLDGSLNFSRQIPICCISIALWQNDSPILGVIYDFNRDELFSGVVGEGAWLNRKPITTSDVGKLSESILCTGFPVSTDFSREGVERFVTAIRTYKKVRLLGSGALSLAYVACGRADAYWENNIKIWDVAAGMAVVKAAGGKLSWEYSGGAKRMHVKAFSSRLPDVEMRGKPFLLHEVSQG